MNNRKIKVKCKFCNKEELVFLSRSKTYNCCSKECMGKFNSVKYSTKIKKECPICHNNFEIKKSQVKRRVCCSYECSNKYRSENKIGENNPNSKRMKIIENGVLKTIYSRYKHPYHKIIQDYFGVKNPFKGYDIHHRDSNHLNDEITNLVLLPRGAHMLLHKHLGSILLRAYIIGKIDKETLFSLCTENEINFLKEVIDLNIAHQVIIKQSDSYNACETSSDIYKYIYMKLNP